MKKSNKILVYPNEALEAKAREVKKFDDSSRSNLLSLSGRLKTANEAAGGMGVAAPQLGVSKRVASIKDIETGRYLTMVNPVVVWESSAVKMLEGCLSIPGFSWVIARPNRIKVEYRDIYGSEYCSEFDGWFARAIQHEIDHLNGTLIVDYLDKDEWEEFADEYFGGEQV